MIQTLSDAQKHPRIDSAPLRKKLVADLDKLGRTVRALRRKLCS